MTQTEKYLLRIIKKMYDQIKDLQEAAVEERRRMNEINLALRAIFDTTQEYCDFLNSLKEEASD